MPSPHDPTAAQQPAGAQAPPVLSPARVCLFLDFDGTLVEFADHPAAVRLDPQLVPLLQSLQAALAGAMAIISGRRIEDLDAMLRPLRLPIAGLHGLERRDAQGRQPLPRPAATPELRLLREQMSELAGKHPDLLLEDKLGSLAIHYRRAPHLEATVDDALAAMIAPLRPLFQIVPGVMVREIKPGDRDKATAVEAFMREEPFTGRLPVFVGDDLTDSDGFGAVRRYGGMSVAVGDRLAAQWRLPDPAAVRGWLRAIADTTRGAGP